MTPKPGTKSYYIVNIVAVIRHHVNGTEDYEQLLVNVASMSLTFTTMSCQ